MGVISGQEVSNLEQEVEDISRRAGADVELNTGLERGGSGDNGYPSNNKEAGSRT